MENKTDARKGEEVTDMKAYVWAWSMLKMWHDGQPFSFKVFSSPWRKQVELTYCSRVRVGSGTGEVWVRDEGGK